MCNKEEFVEETRRRFKELAIDVVDLLDTTASSPGMNVIRVQLIKSATSMAANYRAACRARSRAEFFAKMSICVEESDENIFWLEMLRDSSLKINNSKVIKLHSEADRLTAIVVTARRNTRRA